MRNKDPKDNIHLAIFLIITFFASFANYEYFKAFWIFIVCMERHTFATNFSVTDLLDHTYKKSANQLAQRRLSPVTSRCQLQNEMSDSSGSRPINLSSLCNENFQYWYSHVFSWWPAGLAVSLFVSSYLSCIEKSDRLKLVEKMWRCISDVCYGLIWYDNMFLLNSNKKLKTTSLICLLVSKISDTEVHLVKRYLHAWIHRCQKFELVAWLNLVLEHQNFLCRKVFLGCNSNGVLRFVSCLQPNTFPSASNEIKKQFD